MDNGSAKLYRFTGAKLQHITNRNIAVWRTYDDTFKIYPESTIHLLANCKEFKNLDDHARYYLDKKYRKLLTEPVQSPINRLKKILSLKLIALEDGLPFTNREIRLVIEQLEILIRDGFLQSKDELFKKINNYRFSTIASSEETKKIRILGIPTRHRLNLLERCVTSYLKNSRKYDHQIVLHIADDSDESQALENRHVIEQLSKKFQSEIVWADKKFRFAFAKEISNSSHVPEEVAQFTFVGDQRCNLRTGACRNTLLLLSAGERSVQVDDDTVCKLIPSPWMKRGLALSSKADSNHYLYYDSKEVTIENDKRVTNSFFRLHEALLGSHPIPTIKGAKSLNIDYLDAGLLEKISIKKTRIAVTYLGAVGDSGMHLHWPRLIQGQKDIFEHIFSNAKVYKNALLTRQLLRAPVQTTISDGAFCMAMVIGLDTSQLMPPFMPVQRKQDGIFGQLLHLCFKHSLHGYSPWTVIHDPPTRSTFIKKEEALATGPYRTPDVLESILWDMSQWPFTDNPSDNLETVGKYLLDLHQLSPTHFKAFVRACCQRTTQARMKNVKQFLTDHPEAPPYWQRDIQKIIYNFQEMIHQPNICVPTDLSGSISERMVLFQELIGKFGRLLIHWPAMWEAAVKLGDKDWQKKFN